MAVTALAFAAFYAYGLVRSFTVHPRWGLFTYLAAFYLHPPMRWWGAFLPDLRWSMTAAIVTLISVPSAKLPPDAVPWTSHAIAKLMIAYVAWMWIQLFWANPLHLEGTVLMTKYVVLYYLIYRLINDEKALVDFAFIHVLGSLYFGLLALDAPGVGRLELIGGPGVNDSNTLGMHVTTSLLFAASFIFSQTGWKRWAVIASVPFMANCVLQTESRGAFLGAICGGIAYYYFAPKKQRTFIIAFGTISVFVLLAYAPATYWERMSTLKTVETEEERDTSAQSRIELIRAQWTMFREHPFGLGFNTTAYLSQDYLDSKWLSAAQGQDVETEGARSSHNTLMSVLCDQGLPGIVIAVAGIVAVARMMSRLKAINLRQPDRVLDLFHASICGSLVTILVSGMFTNYLKAEVQIWNLALLASALELARRRAFNRAPSELPGRAMPVPH